MAAGTLEYASMLIRKRPKAYLSDRARIVYLVAAALFATPWAAGADWPPAPLLKAATDEAGVLPPSVRAEPVRDGVWRCTFRYKPAAAKSVTLAGTFNGWSPHAAPLTGPDGEGFWTATV